MGIKTLIKNIRNKKSDKGTIYVKPSEVGSGDGKVGYQTPSGPTINVPEGIGGGTLDTGGSITYSGGGGTPTSQIPSGNVGSSLRSRDNNPTTNPRTGVNNKYNNTPKNLTTQQLRNIDLSKYGRGTKTKEVYNQNIKAYQQSLYGYGAGGTAYQRQPTLEEQYKIDRANEKGDIGYRLTGISTDKYNKLSGSMEEISTLTKDLSKNYSKIEDETKRFDYNYQRYIKDGKFVGSKEEYEAYTKDFSRLNDVYSNYNKDLSKLNRKKNYYTNLGGTISESGEIELPKVKLGDLNIGRKTILKGRKVPLERFKGLYSQTGNPVIDAPRKIGSAFDIGAKQMFFAAGETFGKALGEKKKFTITQARELPSYNTTILQPQFGTAKEYNPLTGKVIYKPYKEIEVPSRTRPELYFTGEQLGEAVGSISSFGAEASKVLVPYAGGILYGSEAVGRIKESGGVKKFIKENPAEAALTGAIVLGGLAGGISKGLKVVGQKQLNQQLLRLGKSPIKYVEIVDRGNRKVALKGFQEAGKLRRQIYIKGRIAKTEKGIEIIPSAEGISITAGKVKRLGKQKNFFGVDRFETGGKGVSIPYRNIGDIKMYKTLGTSTYIPQASTYSIFKKGTRLKDIESQFKKNLRLRGDVTKDFSVGNLFRLNENVFLGSKKDRELGLTFVKKAKEQKKSYIINKPTKTEGTPFSVNFAKEFEETPLLNIEQIQEGITKQTLSKGRTNILKDTRAIQTKGTIQEPTQLPIIKEQVKQEISPLQIQENKQRVGIGSGLKQELGKQTKQKEKQIEMLKSLTKQAQNLREKQKQRIKQLLKIKQEEKIIQSTKQLNKLKGIEPKPKTNFIIPLIKSFNKREELLKEKSKEFEAIGFRYGKEKKLGKFLSQSQAEKALSKFLKGTLGASGFLKVGGEKIRAKEINLLGEKEFRVSKRSPFIVVEEKTKRLRKGTTGKDIQFFKKVKKRKSFLGI